VHTQAMSLMANYNERGWIYLGFGLYTIIKNANAAVKIVDHRLPLHVIGLQGTC